MIRLLAITILMLALLFSPGRIVSRFMAPLLKELIRGSLLQRFSGIFIPRPPNSGARRSKTLISQKKKDQ